MTLTVGVVDSEGKAEAGPSGNSSLLGKIGGLGNLKSMVKKDKKAA